MMMMMSVIAVVFAGSFGYVFASRPENAHDQSDGNVVSMPSRTFGAGASYCGHDAGRAFDVIIICRCGCGIVVVVVIVVRRGDWIWNGNGLEVCEDSCDMIQCFCFCHDCFRKG